MAVRQGALQLRDLHEDTTGPGQGREGGGDVLKLNVTLAKSAAGHLSNVEYSLY